MIQSQLDGPYQEGVCWLCSELMKTFETSFTDPRNKRWEVEAVVSVGLMFTATSVILSKQGKYSVMVLVVCNNVANSENVFYFLCC